MREICKSGSMRGSGRPSSNAPATLYSTVPCGYALGALWDFPPAGGEARSHGGSLFRAEDLG
jgi:hypothetical protein